MEKTTPGKVYRTLKGLNYGKYAWITIIVLQLKLSSYFLHFFLSLADNFFTLPNNSRISAGKV